METDTTLADRNGVRVPAIPLARVGAVVSGRTLTLADLTSAVELHTGGPLPLPQARFGTPPATAAPVAGRAELPAAQLAGPRVIADTLVADLVDVPLALALSIGRAAPNVTLAVNWLAGPTGPRWPLAVTAADFPAVPLAAPAPSPAILVYSSGLTRLRSLELAAVGTTVGQRVLTLADLQVAAAVAADQIAGTIYARFGSPLAVLPPIPGGPPTGQVIGPRVDGTRLLVDIETVPITHASAIVAAWSSRVAGLVANWVAPDRRGFALALTSLDFPSVAR